jgi:hypothetical protein
MIFLWKRTVPAQERFIKFGKDNEEAPDSEDSEKARLCDDEEFICTFLSSIHRLGSDAFGGVVRPSGAVFLRLKQRKC